MVLALAAADGDAPICFARRTGYFVFLLAPSHRRLALLWVLSVQSRADVHLYWTKLQRRDAVHLTASRGFPAHLCYLHEWLLRIFSVQLHTALQSSSAVFRARTASTCHPNQAPNFHQRWGVRHTTQSGLPSWPIVITFI